MKTTAETPAEIAIETAREKHIEKINALIDAIINLEDYYEQLPADLRKALNKANELRFIAEEEIEQGDYVYDSFNGKAVVVLEVGTVNFNVAEAEVKDNSKLDFVKDKKCKAVIDYKAGTEYWIGKKFCFKRHF